MPDSVKERVRVVMWSGGHDSTLVLWREIKRVLDPLELDPFGQSPGENDWKRGVVRAWTLKCERFGLDQQRAEQSCMEKFKQKVAGTIDVCHETFGVDMGNLFPGGHGGQQAGLMLPLSVYLAPHGSTLLFGYNYNDSFWRSAFRFKEICELQCGAAHKDVKFEFPLQWVSKNEVVKEIEAAGLSDCVWTCEDPVDTGNLEPCGKCESCVSLELASYEIELRTKLALDRELE